MNQHPAPIKRDETPPGETACGARIDVAPHTPTVCYQGEIIHFCSEDCRQLYTEDPLNSCLASRLLSDK